MWPIGIRIESGAWLAYVVLGILVVTALVAAFARWYWLKAHGEEVKGSFASTLVIALGIELGVVTGLALLASDFAASAKVTLAVILIVLPATAALIRARSHPASRAGTFGRTFAAVLGIELVPMAVVLLLVGAACLNGSGYVEF